MAKKQYNVKTSAVAATERRARKYGVAGGSAYVAGGYIDMAGDVAGKLDRGVFESMFERIVTGTDDDGNEKWYIKAKATLVSVGDVVAYGVSDITGGAGGGSSTLANLKDVLLGTPMAGDVIKWDASLGKWVNGSAPAGGLDESSLAAYLQQHNYVTSAALGDYVTVDTEQTISGKKTFGACETFFTRRATINGDFSGPENCPHIMWHVPNQEFTKMLMDVNGNLHLLWGGATDLNNYRGLTVSSIAKYGGTSSQFLKADGSVDGTHYLYHRRTAEGFNIDTIDAVGGGLYEVPLAAGTVPFNNQNWQKVLDFGANDNGYRVQLNTPLTLNGSLYLRHKIGGTWHGWREILDSANYPAYLDGRYVNASGDTMTGPLTVPLNGLIVGSDGGDTYAGRVLRAYADSSTGLYLNLGHDPSTGNCGEFSFSYAGAASASNSVSMGFYGGKNLTITYGGGISWNSNTIWHAGNDGSGSGLDADLLDGTHGSQYLLCNKYWDVNADNISNGVGFCYANGAPTKGPVVDFGCGSGYNLQFSAAYSTFRGETLHYRTHNGDTNIWNPWCQIARISDNVASATVLQNTRYLWGQAFNGGGDVNGTFYYNNGDGTLKIYGIAPQSYGHETVAIQTAFDAQDPETSPYPYTYPDRNVLTLQPRGGRVGIGLANPSCMLHVNGTILANGDVTAYSDARLKSDIRPLTNRGFIEPKTYIKGGKRSIGFLAQDVMAIYPELVTDTGGADHWLALNYGNLVAVLEAQIIVHEERIKRLEERV